MSAPSRSRSGPGDPPRAGRRRAAHLGPAIRRPQVLDATLKLLVEHGYAGTSMGAIADAVGVTKPVVYECYPSKRELFGALLEREEGRIVAAIGSALGEEWKPVEESEEAYTQGFTALLTAARDAPDSWRIVFDSRGGPDPAVERRAREVRTLVVERLAAMIAAALEAGDRPRHGGDPARVAPVLAEMVVAIGESGVRTMLTTEGAWTPAELGSLLGRVAARGIEDL
ncbi:MAG: TetR/AcrR family transcriptional regulator [Solirubrobacterales bacterium]|nr:TetR/AcrR family transcriptional regulator [Solirubrobacterales bacterium]